VLGNEGIGGIAFCPLAQGLLTDRYLHGIPGDSRASKPHGFLKKNDIDEHRLARSARWARWPPSADSRWRRWLWPGCCATSRMTSALIGASRVEQIEQNVARWPIWLFGR
jgi:L-glyceraldehyde 3-phosphate reductase